jgi:hypothetical protein
MITNITLKGDRFVVFANINGIDEVNTFMPEVTAKDINNWVAERQAYYSGLNTKLETLKAELVNLEAKYSDVPEIKEVIKK